MAVADVDFGFVEKTVQNKTRDRDGQPRPTGVRLQEKFVKAKRFADWREMLEKQKNIEAVLIATPDHQHAVIAKAAMEMGKHVYLQKPLTYSVHEARVLRETARHTKVATQMGNQGHSSEGARLINEWYQAGLIGPVREVQVWTNRPIWPQGIPRPGQTQPPLPPAPPPPAGPQWNRGGLNDLLATAMMGSYPRPDTLHWDLYLGPVASDVAYHPIYHPFNWRGWVDFGVGALGDMGAHLIDHPYWALGLTYPTSIEATSTPWGGPRDNPVTYPWAMTVHYEFPARGLQPPVSMTWYDGGLMPPRPDALPDDVVLTREGGVLFIGERGVLLHETYGDNPRLFPASLHRGPIADPKSIARVEGHHEKNWVNGCKDQGQASCPIEYAARLTETMLLGIVALRTGQGRKILYDGDTMTVANAPEANQYLKREYRSGWAV
ncbi:MAG: Gfo/Idh/MocA family oxidoreductase [Gemmatimonadetes bacterium]|nr:Gfo/Idh/MocA family oxidoreductase [Gemmatimonadota bacterium]